MAIIGDKALLPKYGFCFLWRYLSFHRNRLQEGCIFPGLYGFWGSTCAQWRDGWRHLSRDLRICDSSPDLLSYRTSDCSVAPIHTWWNLLANESRKITFREYHFCMFRPFRWRLQSRAKLIRFLCIFWQFSSDHRMFRSECAAKHEDKVMDGN